MQAGQTQLECIDLYQLRRIDPKIPAEETLAELIEEGKIRYVGLSEVSVKQIEHTRQIVPIVSVQNRYNLTDCGSEEMLEYCEREGIYFILWFPLANRDLARPGSPVEEFTRRKGATPAQIALTWLLAHSEVMRPHQEPPSSLIWRPHSRILVRSLTLAGWRAPLPEVRGTVCVLPYLQATPCSPRPTSRDVRLQSARAPPRQ